MKGMPDNSRTMALVPQGSAAHGNAAADELPFPGRGLGFCLVMKLRYPAQIGDLLTGLQSLTGTSSPDPRTGQTHASEIDKRLRALKYVHYSRFVPLVDRGELLIVTEFDGNQQDYVLDFAAVLDREFSFILSFMEDAPALPVRENPQAFYAYVARNTKLLGPQELPDSFRPVGPLDGRSVLDILGDDVYATHDPKALLPDPPSASAGAVSHHDLSDIQANIVKGFAAQSVRHYFLRFADDPASRAALLRQLCDSMTGEGAAGLHCVNVGLTFQGLQALGVPHDVCRRFAPAFQRGPSADTHGFVPGTWPTRDTQEDAGREPVHVVVSLSLGPLASAETQPRLEQLFAQTTARWSHFEGRRLDDAGGPGMQDMLVHFGLRDGISQPKIHGIAHGRRDTEQPDCMLGDFVLGHANSRGGNYLGALPAGLAKNATYSAFLVIDQMVQAFEQRARWRITPALELPERERAILYAEKLLGRKADGRPVHFAKDDGAGASRNAFDFWQIPPEGADQRASACPFGAHIRRMNPRRGVVVGVPAGRRIIRRGMPYGSRFDPEQSDAQSRGLVGHFFCGDLQDQYEFLQRVWGSGDVSAPGLGTTRDPFAATRSTDTPFRFEWSPNGTAPRTYTLTVPPLVATRFAIYLFMPGRQGLRWLADRSWEPRSPGRHPVAPSSRVGGIETPLPADPFDPLDRRFMQTPHRYYAALRRRHIIPVGQPCESYWALSYAAVRDALESSAVVKPGLGRGAPPDRPEGMVAGLRDGLFFQDPERHDVVRRCLDPAFPAGAAAPESTPVDAPRPGAGAASSARIRALAQAKADELLDAADAKGVFDVVSEFAGPLTSHVFMEVMGIPLDPLGSERGLVDAWVRGALAGHDPSADQDLRVGGLTASMALRAYFMALGQCPASTETHPSIMDAIRGNIGGASAGGADLAVDEAMNTSLQFALGGFLSTQFLITTGTSNLLLHATEWRKLQADRSDALMDLAIDEMLRFDSPFMMADRWVPKGVTIAGIPLEASTKLTLVYGSANRDPSYFAQPEQFDISLDRPTRHLAFGGQSPYNCIGRFMARWVAQVAFRSLIDRFPDASIAEIGPWLTDPYYRSLSRLTVYTG